MEKTSELNLARLAAFVLAIILGIYVGYGFYIGIQRPLAGSMTWGMLLGSVVGLVIVGISYYLCMMSPKSMTFLNETEGELRKVVWPKSKPISASTELWQYTIAVVVLMLVLIVYISIVDSLIDILLKNFIL